MEVKLHESFSSSLLAQDSATAIEACVHCGFCLATCPTYLDTRDERDSPRGRIYLIKDLLETASSDRIAQTHIDSCLNCRSCETTCPSGVRYADILDGGRELLDERVSRPVRERLFRWLLLRIVPRPRRFAALLRFGQVVAPILPPAMRRKVPQRQAPPARAPARTVNHSGQPTRAVVLLEGCVQSAATPNTNLAVRGLLERLGLRVLETPAQGCCGALNAHLGNREQARNDMRRNIDAWWAALEGGAEAVISSATGCASELDHYVSALKNDPAYADKAAKISGLACDFGAFLSNEPLNALGDPAVLAQPRVAVQTPCSQTHALRQSHTVRHLLEARGYTLTVTRDDHLCCGSAGSYSLLHPQSSGRLRSRKLAALGVDTPDVIASANVGCQLHLGELAEVPVRHWTELMWDSVSQVELGQRAVTE